MSIKKLYNNDNSLSIRDWLKIDLKNKKYIDVPKLSSFITIKNNKINCLIAKDSIGYIFLKSNTPYTNPEQVVLFSSLYSDGHGVSIITQNFYKTIMVFTARKTIKCNWINDQDEYKKTPLPEL